MFNEYIKLEIPSICKLILVLFFLWQSAYMKKFLTLVQKKMDEGVVDITLKFTLSALWNLTGNISEIPGLD